MKIAFIPLALLLGVVASPAGAMCFTVYDSGNRIVYRSDTTPVDLSGRIGPPLQRRFPGGLLIIIDDNRMCTFISPTSPVEVLAGYGPAAPGGGTVSSIATPAPDMSWNTGGSAPEAASNEGCRRGGYENRRGVPCDDAVVVGPGVVRAPGAAVEGAAGAPLAVERPARRVR